MYRIAIWTILGALTGLAFAILCVIPPSLPSRFWDAFYQIEPVVMKPATLIYRCWVQWMPLHDGEFFSFIRFFVASIVQWLVLGFVVGASAHFSLRRRKECCEEQIKREHDHVA